jgi:PAT family acetyl-CoA transporter-like MFS transporter 1
MVVTRRQAKEQKSGEFILELPIDQSPPVSDGYSSKIPTRIFYEESSDMKDITMGQNLPNWKKDKCNILLLFLLYILQGIPLGFTGSIPFILLTRQVDYSSQAMFSFAFYPFSLKLLWAPIVDSLFNKRMGRRKTWLIPVQYLLGLLMLYISVHVDSLLGSDTEPPRILLLCCLFFSLNFLAATQDIAVDGWALSMLSKENLGHASTCNSVGQTAGYFMSYSIFLALESKEFCNNYIMPSLGLPQQESGILTISGFLYFWAVVFMIVTTLVWIFKKEKEDPCCESVVQTYRDLWKIMWLPTVFNYIIILLTCKVGFAAADAITGLKLIEAGVHKETLALLAIPLTPVQLVLPLIIARYTAGPKPMTKVWLRAYPVRIVFGLSFAWLVYYAGVVKNPDGSFPVYFYALMMLIFLIHQIFTNCMFVSTMSFAAQISDPVMGGTYMTMLNTFTNFGGNWPATASLYLVNILTVKTCSTTGQSCVSADQLQQCVDPSVEGVVAGQCVVQTDGYYILSVVLAIAGFVWLALMSKRLTYLQNLPMSRWSVASYKAATS